MNGIATMTCSAANDARENVHSIWPSGRRPDVLEASPAAGASPSAARSRERPGGGAAQSE